jgi:hypothetical protein
LSDFASAACDDDFHGGRCLMGIDRLRYILNDMKVLSLARLELGAVLPYLWKATKRPDKYLLLRRRLRTLFFGGEKG